MSTSGSVVTAGQPSAGVFRSAVAAMSKPLGGLISVGIGVSGFAVPALHGLGTPFSTALIVAGLGAYGLSVGVVTGAISAQQAQQAAQAAAVVRTGSTS